MNNFAVIGAFVAAGVSLLVALAGFRVQRRLQRAGQDHAVEIEKLKAELGRRTAEDEALRKYTYDARQRLYQTCEPLLFQLAERFEDLHARIYGLARTARDGKLEPPTGWLSGRPGYYARSTMYRLVAPVALYQLLGEQMTSVDLSVDTRIRQQYLLAKQFALTLTDSWDLAAVQPVIVYTPHDTGDDAVRRANQSRYWTQGVSVGGLDSAAQALVNRDDARPRLLRFGEFDKLYDVRGSAVHESFTVLEYLLGEFHPRNRPVLWRILLAQARICVAFLDVNRGPEDNPLRRQQDREKELLDWRRSEDDAPDDDVLEIPFVAAAAYLRETLPEGVVDAHRRSA